MAIVSFDRFEFTSGFHAAAGAVGRAQNATRNVLCRVTDGKLQFVGTDNNVSVVSTFATDQPDMEVLLPTQRVQAILREAKDDKVFLDVGKNYVVIQAGGSKFRLATEDVQDFPPVVAEMPEECWEVPGHVFIAACRRTTFAIDDNSTRYAMGGVSIDDMQFCFVATDSRRLAVQSVVMKARGVSGPSGDSNVVPERLLNIVERLVQDGDVVLISLAGSAVMIQTGHTIVSAQKVIGRFPKWQTVVPRYSNKIALPVGGLTAALRKAVICTSEENRGVWMRIVGGMLRLTSEAAEIGSSDVELTVETGVDFEAKVDPKYLLDMLKALPSEETIEMSFGTADDALLFRRDGYQYVLMPLAD